MMNRKSDIRELTRAETDRVAGGQFPRIDRKKLLEIRRKLCIRANLRRDLEGIKRYCR